MTPERLLAQDAVLVAGLAVAVYAIVGTAVRYRRRRTPGLLVAATVAVGAGAFLIAATWPRALDLARPSHWTGYPGGRLGAIVLLAVAGVAVAAVDGVLGRLTVLFGRRGSAGDDPAGPVTGISTAIAAVTAVTAAALFGVLTPSAPVEGGPATAGSLVGAVEATHRLPGGPLGVALVGPDSGYVVLYPDTVARFELPTSADMAIVIEPLLHGLESPRGVAVADGHLFVTESGDLPCPDPAVPNCLGLPPAELELATIAQARGRITRYPILPDGSLGTPEVIFDGLPVASYDHGVNTLTVGPDGRVYAAIGGFGDLSLYPDLAATIDHDRGDLFGTIISFDPDGGDLRVFARGLRNVYGLAFSPDGNLYAADNDGEALNALRAEELLHIVEGGDYGFPTDGSFAPFTVRTEFPLWLLDQVASAGIAWSDDPQGVVVGSLSWVHLVELGTRPGAAGLLVGSRGSVRRVVQVNGYATTVDLLGGGRLLVGVFNPWSPEEDAFLVVSLG
jgi:hypothetical protein